MAPKKIAEKRCIKVLDLKPKKSVRKKIPTAKILTGVTLERPSMADLSIPSDDIQDLEILPCKNTKAKLANKINMNGIKTIKACKAGTEESHDPEDVPGKNKKTKVPSKQNMNEKIILHDSEDIEPYVPETVSSINIKTKATAEIISQEYVPTKIKNAKATRINKHDQNGINIPFVNEDTNDNHNPEDVPSKIKRVRGTQKQKNFKMIIAKEGNTHATADEIGNSPDDVPPKTKRAKAAYKQNQNEIKIMLANEVIRNAFQKKTKILKEPPRPGRRKKAVRKVDDTIENANNEPNKTLLGHESTDGVVKKRAVKGDYRKKTSTALDASQELPTVTSELPVTGESPKKRRTLSLRRKALKQENKQTFQKTDIGKEGKEETQESTLIGSNVTLFISNELPTPDSTSKTGSGTQSQKPHNISCRKNSGASTSTCLSWTKDISSSSTITCITVKSNDFVRIDKKLPIVKLTNVDGKLIIKHTVDNIYEENSIDSRQEKSKNASDCSSVSIANLNVSQKLNLSTSSLTSVTTNKIAQNKSVIIESKNERLIKLRQSLENLSCKMKNFDLEIINWIGYDNEIQNPNTKNFHTRIFEVLKDENQVIKYCKEIKRVLVGDINNQQSTKIIEECPNNIELAHPKPEAIDKLSGNDPCRTVTDGSDKKNRNIIEKPLICRKEDTNFIPDRDEIFKESESFDKDIEVHDNDDDDALSLFAESITGLESSRKNSSLAIPVSNDKSVIQQSDSIESTQSNERVCQPITKVEKDKKPVTNQMINNVKKQTADSSTVFNKPNESNIVCKFRSDHSKPFGNVHNRFSDTFRVDNLGFTYNNFQYINGTATSNILNKSLLNKSAEFPDTHIKSPIDASENSSNRSSEFQNYTGRSLSSLFENNSVNVSQNVSEITGNNISENCNNRTSEVQGNITNKQSETVCGAENSIWEIPRSQQLAIANKQMNARASSIFKGVCIFNLVNNCKNIICNYPHKHIDREVVTNKLRGMNEETFVGESMYILKWLVLKRKYGMCFVEECIRRNLTVRLLYLVKAFVAKHNRKSRDEETFDVEIIEAALLHLNNADIEPCADTLRSEIKPKIFLCDALMKVISESQNFSRFKRVFIKLALFMCKIGRSFRLDVATQILERLCILPYDDALARALMKIIAKTDPSIFNIPMMGLLENQLSKNNLQLYNELMSLKLQVKEYSQYLASSPMQSPHIASSNVELQTSTPIARADSPDTTNMNFVNKAVEPVITRTITINRTINTSNLNMSAGSESSEEPVRRYEPRILERTWRNYPPNLMSLRSQRQVYKRLRFAPRASIGTHPKLHWRFSNQTLTKKRMGSPRK